MDNPKEDIEKKQKTIRAINHALVAVAQALNITTPVTPQATTFDELWVQSDEISAILVNTCLGGAVVADHSSPLWARLLRIKKSISLLSAGDTCSPYLLPLPDLFSLFHNSVVENQRDLVKRLRGIMPPPGRGAKRPRVESEEEVEKMINDNKPLKKRQSKIKVR